MAARVTTWLAIVIGGTGGTLAALVGSSDAPASAPAGPPPLVPHTANAAQPARVARPAGEAEPRAAPSASSPVSSAQGSSAADPKPSAPLPEAELLPLPIAPRALLRAEMRCDQRKAESCIVAARSYESASAGVSDPEKAAKYRRIALTAWISQCDHNSPAACATLASMYRAGSGVPRSDRNADALIARARDLCRYNDVPVCRDLPTP